MTFESHTSGTSDPSLDSAGTGRAQLGTAIGLTPTEFRLLHAFVEHSGQALTRAQLLDLVWGDD